LEAIGRSEIANDLAKNADLDEDDAGRMLDALIEVMKGQLLAGKEIVLPGFAALKVVEKKAHIVKDAETGHQYISPAENVVSFVPLDNFQQQIESAKLSSIVLAMPAGDPFAGVIEFHFASVGWRVHMVHTKEACFELLAAGAHLVIVDQLLDGSLELISEIKALKTNSPVPLITLYPEANDPETSHDFIVLGDEHLVEPFEVYTLLMLAEHELARSSEEEVIFEQQVNFQFSSREQHVEQALGLAQRLFKASGLEAQNQVSLLAAFREAITNAMVHGNSGDPNKLVKVLYLLDREKITIVVQDQGSGFAHREALKTASGETGVGLALLRKCADLLEYNDVGDMLTLTKFLNPSRV
jgi:serine/threonine-protein kinase RsbW